MKRIVLFLSIIVASGLFMVSIYNTVVDAKSWGSDIPGSIQAARDYYKHVDPRRFYAFMGPINQLLSLLTVILFWKESRTLRFDLVASFVLYAAIVALTFAYFIPRDLILFTWPMQDHIADLRAASAEWSRMNWVRSLLGLAGIFFSFHGLHTYYGSQDAARSVNPAGSLR